MNKDTYKYTSVFDVACVCVCVCVYSMSNKDIRKIVGQIKKKCSSQRRLGVGVFSALLRN